MRQPPRKRCDPEHVAARRGRMEKDYDNQNTTRGILAVVAAFVLGDFALAMEICPDGALRRAACHWWLRTRRARGRSNG